MNGPPRDHGADTGAWVTMIASTVLFASSYSLTKIALADIPPITLGLIRFAIAALALAAWQGRRLRVPDRRTRRALALAGLLGVTAYFALENVGVQLATATDAALLVAAYPVFTIAVEAVLHRRRPSVGLLIGVGVTGAGVITIVAASGSLGDSVSARRLLGDVILVLTGLVWAGYTLISQRTLSDLPVLQVVTWQNAFGALGFLPLALVDVGKWHRPTHPVATTLAVGALVAACSIGAMLAYNKALAGLASSTAVNALNLVPLWGVLIAGLVLHEHLTAWHVLGGVIVLIGVAVTTRSPSTTPTQQLRSSDIAREVAS